MKILWLANVPSPYRVDFFNELGRHCDLTVVFEKRTSDERDKTWLNYKFESFQGVFLTGKSINTDTAFCPSVIRYLKDTKYNLIIVTNMSSPTGIIAICYMRLHKIDYWIEGDGGFAKKGNFIKTKLKKYMISGAKGFFSTSKTHDEYYLSYGAKLEKIYRYPFTSINQSDITKAGIFDEQDKHLLRQELALKEERIILSVVNTDTYSGCEADLGALLRCAEILGEKTGVFVIIEESTNGSLNRKYDICPKNVHFIGLNNKDMAKYYGMADCFVFLSRDDSWKPVLYEAMVYGLPIITTTRCVAGNELVEDGINGVLITDDNTEIIAECIKNLLTSDKKTIFGKASYEKILNCTIENKDETHIKICGMAGEKRALIRYLAKQRINIPQDKKVILYVGQMIFRKGVDILLKSAKDLSKERNDLLFLLVGGALSDSFLELKSGIPDDSIKTVAFLSKEELSLYYRAATLFCLPTREDIWGLVINEGMSFGLPIITTTKCGSGNELIENGVNGYLLDVVESTNLSMCIQKLIMDPKLYCAEEESIKKIAGYSIEKMVQRHIELFNTLS